ncbi:MAG: carboxypeptidase-like regulatory domain-containing protein [Bacteroides sp.]|nr:carboxypeptidase-like regulatory domain-containing protein [Bacteroides sp.]
MKKVKVFIASSAELDEDKKQLDLFFAERNKIYEQRDILFVQKTWKDFESSLHEHFLQDRYDDYIRRCDIVIFLFHTRLGKYTLRELNIAHETFLRSKKGQPRIYIFYRETAEQTSELADFKRFSEKDYGHFCDTYADYPELLRKVEKQLQLLENNGYIVPMHFDSKKALRYMLFYILLPLLVLASAFAAIHYYSDIDMTVRVIEDSAQCIPSLPFRKGTLEVQYGEGEVQVYALDDIHSEALVKGIHSKYRGEDARIRFMAPGYVTIDTLMSIASDIQLPIRRNDDLKFIFGSVADEKGMPIEEARITVQDLTVETNSSGNFRVEIPLAKQAEEQMLTAFKPGYSRWIFTAPVIPNVAWNIVLKKETD